MGYLFSFAMKNLLRYKRRTLLTFLVLSVGVAMYIWFACLLEGFSRQSFENIINFDTGHFKIRSAQFDEDDALAVTNMLPAEKIPHVEASLRSKKFVTGFTRRILFTGEADNSIDALPVVITGLDPNTDGKVFSLLSLLESGTLDTNGAVLGSGLAKDLGLKKGDMVYLTFRRQRGQLDSVALPITEVIRSSDPTVNSAMVYIGLAKARQLLGTKDVTEIAVKTTDMNKYKTFGRDLEKSLSGVKVFSWYQLAKDVLAIAQAKEGGSFVMVMFLVIIALVGIVNTMLMSVYEKRQEIGTLKALGMTDGDVRKVFLIEGGLIGVMGCLAGLVLGTLANLYFVEVGWDISAMLGGMDNIKMGYQVTGVVKSVWLVAPYFQALLFSVLASVLASYLPARKTTEMQPAECLRTVQ